MTSIVQSLTLPHVLSDEEDVVEFVDDEDDEVVEENDDQENNEHRDLWDCFVAGS